MSFLWILHRANMTLQVITMSGKLQGPHSPTHRGALYKRTYFIDLTTLLKSSSLVAGAGKSNWRLNRVFVNNKTVHILYFTCNISKIVS